MDALPSAGWPHFYLEQRMCQIHIHNYPTWLAPNFPKQSS